MFQLFKILLSSYAYITLPYYCNYRIKILHLHNGCAFTANSKTTLLNGFCLITLKLKTTEIIPVEIKVKQLSKLKAQTPYLLEALQLSVAVVLIFSCMACRQKLLN